MNPCDKTPEVGNYSKECTAADASRTTAVSRRIARPQHCSSPPAGSGSPCRRTPCSSRRSTRNSMCPLHTHDALLAAVAARFLVKVDVAVEPEWRALDLRRPTPTATKVGRHDAVGRLLARLLHISRLDARSHGAGEEERPREGVCAGVHRPRYQVVGRRLARRAPPASQSSELERRCDRTRQKGRQPPHVGPPTLVEKFLHAVAADDVGRRRLLREIHGKNGRRCAHGVSCALGQRL